MPNRIQNPGKICPVTIQTNAKLNLSDILARQAHARGITPLALEPDLLLQRIRQGGDSGQFLADAYISAYRTHVPFGHSLGELIRLDTEGQRLFFQILCLRLIPGWSDEALYAIEQKILLALTRLNK